MRFDYQSPITRLGTMRARRLLGVGGLLALSFVTYLTIKSPSTEAPQADFDLAQANPSLNKSALDKQLIAAAEMHALEKTEKWKSIAVKSGDSVSKIFTAAGISPNILHKMLNANPASKQLSNIHPGQIIHFLFDEHDEFKELKLSVTASKTLHVRTTDKGFKFYYEEKQLSKRYAFSSNTIRDSLFTAAQSSGLNDKLIMQMADIFGWDIDFGLDIRENDSFRVLYEEEYLDDEKVDSGQIIVAEFINQGKVYRAIRFTDESGKVGYYTPEGYSLQKAFLRSPVKFTHISSHFSLGRHHPVLHRIRAHKGVDYAAPSGTPIKAAGDGRVSFLGTKGGYGKTIELTHGKKYSTLYAHLSRYHPDIKENSVVKQGQVIGYVGRTGLATGDHLHYEFRINGVHRNPVTVQLPRSQPIEDARKHTFTSHAEQMVSLLDNYAVAHVAGN